MAYTWSEPLALATRVAPSGRASTSGVALVANAVSTGRGLEPATAAMGATVVVVEGGPTVVVLVVAGEVVGPAYGDGARPQAASVRTIPTRRAVRRIICDGIGGVDVDLLCSAQGRRH